MILVDTAVWVDHLRRGVPALERLLDDGLVLGHPWVTGELALGHLVQRNEIIAMLGNLVSAEVAAPVELLAFVDRHALMGTGIGYVDAQLLAATSLTPEAGLWSSDQQLAARASDLGLAVDPAILGGR